MKPPVLKKYRLVYFDNQYILQEKLYYIIDNRKGWGINFSTKFKHLKFSK